MPLPGPCQVCPQNYPPIPGNGPVPARYLIVGERPGRDELHYNMPFVGKSGQELDKTYLPLGGIRRDECFVTNAVACYADQDRTPTTKEVEICARTHLAPMIETVRPKLIILMGSSAIKLLPGINLDMHHGIPLWRKLFSYEGWIVPQYHPALGLHESRWMTFLLDDWSALRTRLANSHPPRPPRPPDFLSEAPYVRGSLTSTEAADSLTHISSELRARVYDFIDRSESGATCWDCELGLAMRHQTASARIKELKDAGLIEDTGRVRQTASGRNASIYVSAANRREKADYQLADLTELAAYSATNRDGNIAVDTEDHCGVPFSVQISHTPGTGRMVLASDKDSIHFLARLLHYRHVILHNCVHDLDVLEKLGIYPTSYSDTMQESFHQGNLPQGLKPLTYRLFGRTMTSWEDVVRPYSIRALLEWLGEAVIYATDELALYEVKKLKTKIRETKKKSPVEALLRRVIQHTDVESDYDPWERLSEFFCDEANSWMTHPIENKYGNYPKLGIGNVPQRQAVVYGCNDADATLQLGLELARRREDTCWHVAEGDGDDD